jgi:hypothetical protein
VIYLWHWVSCSLGETHLSLTIAFVGRLEYQRNSFVFLDIPDHLPEKMWIVKWFELGASWSMVRKSIWSWRWKTGSEASL